MLVEFDGVLYFGDVVYVGCVLFIGDVDICMWLKVIDQLFVILVCVMVFGYGFVLLYLCVDVQLICDYLVFFCQQMGFVVSNFVLFDEVYQQVDWSWFEVELIFGVVNCCNVYNVYLQMEQELFVYQGCFDQLDVGGDVVQLNLVSRCDSFLVDVCIFLMLLDVLRWLLRLQMIILQNVLFSVCCVVVSCSVICL